MKIKWHLREARPVHHNIRCGAMTDAVSNPAPNHIRALNMNQCNPLSV